MSGGGRSPQEGFDQQVPATPLKAVTAAEKKDEDSQRVDSKTSFMALTFFQKNFSRDKGFLIENCRGSCEDFRLKLANALTAIHPKAALLALRPGDPRIKPVPSVAGGASVPFQFEPKYNVMLFQMLSTVCILGHAAGLIAEFAIAEDGRAALFGKTVVL